MNGLLILVAAGVAALAFFWLVSRVLRRQLPDTLRELLQHVAGPARLAFVVTASGLALPITTLPEGIRGAVEHGLLLAVIALIGWGFVAATAFASDLFMRRFDDPQNMEDVAARKHATRARLLKRAADFLIILITVAAALTTFESVRQWGVSLFASAGAAGLILGLAARPVLSNLIAGIQIAVTQPIRLEDAVVVDKELGRIEEISSAFVVVRLADCRRMIVPLSHFIEKPFENWTREPASLVARVVLRTGLHTDIDTLRAQLKEATQASPSWDGKVCRLEVIDQTRDGLEVRALVSAADPEHLWDLSCEVRERMLPHLAGTEGAPSGQAPSPAPAKSSVRRPTKNT